MPQAQEAEALQFLSIFPFMEYTGCERAGYSESQYAAGENHHPAKEKLQIGHAGGKECVDQGFKPHNTANCAKQTENQGYFIAFFSAQEKQRKENGSHEQTDADANHKQHENVHIPVKWIAMQRDG